MIPDLLAHAVRRYPGKGCVAIGDQELTYEQVSDRAGRLAAHLTRRGLGPGDRVAFLALNELQFVEIRVGAARARVTLVPLNWRLTAPELAAIVADCEPALLIAGPGFESVAAELPVEARMSLVDATGFESYEDALAAADPLPLPAGLPDDDIQIISYTSGTTGRPKGVMKSNRATWFELMSMAQEYRALPDSVYVANMPMFHISCNVGLAVIAVGALHLQTRRFDVDEFLDLVDRRGVTHAQLVPAMIQAVLERWGDRPPTIRSVMYGGSPMPVTVARRALAAWPGCRFINTFGLTEAMGVTMLSPEEHDPDGAPELLRSVGRSAPFMTWRVVDDDDRDVPAGTVGEVVAAGPNLLDRLLAEPGGDGGGAAAAAGSTPATSATATRTATCSSSTAATTASSPAARTSIRARSSR